MAWLDELFKQTEETESPERYYWWAGIATISAIARKNVWLSRAGRYNLYPNVYVALISAKSGVKKGEPIRICKNLLHEVDLIRVISGCNSIQGLVNDLGQQLTLEKSRGVINEAHGFLVSGEFSTFLTNDPMALDTLTDLFNTHENEPKWEKTLKSGKLTLKSPCLTMLFASNEKMLNTVIKPKDMEGGFIARTFIVKENRPGKLNALMGPPRTELNIIGLSQRLLEISRIKGPFEPTKETREKYTEWYESCGYQEIEDRTGTFNRLPDQILKIAMIISLSRKDDLNLEWEDVQLAIEKCEECAYDAANISPSNELSNGDRPNVKKLVIDMIVNSSHDGIRYATTKALLLRKLQPYQISNYQLDICIKDLFNADSIDVRIYAGEENKNVRTIIRLTEEGCKTWLMRRRVN